MKHYFLPLFCAGVSLALSCGGNNNNETTEKATTPTDTVAPNCYLATFNNDTAKMELTQQDSATVTAKLRIDYADDNFNDGTFKGTFKGDTLLGDYVFSTKKDKGSFTNPMVFLKNGDTLTMGIGQIETTLGRSYFVKGKPLNFDRAKFVFSPTDCK